MCTDPGSVLFKSHHELSRLPYFELRGGRLVLADRRLGPAIDMHTHLSMAFFISRRVDLHRPGPRTEHYLPLQRALDLEVYANKNLTPDDLRRVSRDFTGSVLCPVAQGMRTTHTIPNLIREMREMGIERAALLPIDWPFGSSNAETYLRQTSGQGDVVCFGSVHPYARNLAGTLARQQALGARGIKVHPFVQLVRPDNPRAMKLYRLCGHLGLPVLWHCGPAGIELGVGQRRSQVRFYEPAVAESPQTTFILGHSGALQMDLALELARRYPNVWLELSSQSLANVRRILELAPPERIVLGSDWPFYHQAVALAKVLIATEGEHDLRRKVLYENAARLLRL